MRIISKEKLFVFITMLAVTGVCRATEEGDPLYCEIECRVSVECANSNECRPMMARHDFKFSAFVQTEQESNMTLEAYQKKCAVMAADVVRYYPVNGNSKYKIRKITERFPQFDYEKREDVFCKRLTKKALDQINKS